MHAVIERVALMVFRMWEEHTSGTWLVVIWPVSARSFFETRRPGVILWGSLKIERSYWSPVVAARCHMVYSR